MHEASLIASLLRQVDELVAQNGGGRLAQIHLEVGPLAGVESVLLNEAFLRLRGDTSAREAKLVIEAVPLKRRCRSCGIEHESEELRFLCPMCGGACDVISGDAVILHSCTVIQEAEVAL